MSHDNKPSLKRRWKRFRGKLRARRYIIIPIVAIVICALIGGILISKMNSGKTMPSVNNPNTVSEPEIEVTNPLEDKICVCFGDSLTASNSNKNDYPSVLANKTGMEVINLGFSGTRVSNITSEEEYEAYNAFSLTELTYSITKQDFYLQDLHKENEVFTDTDTSYKTELLKTISFDDVDYITLCYGMDDIRKYSAPLDDPSNPLNPETFLGALRYSIELIQNKYPDIEIILLTPVYRQLSAADPNSDELLVNDMPYTAWVNGILEIGKEYELLSIDLYKLTGFNVLNAADYYNYPHDIIHPNNKGLIVIGNIVANKMTEYFG